MFNVNVTMEIDGGFHGDHWYSEIYSLMVSVLIVVFESRNFKKYMLR